MEPSDADSTQEPFVRLCSEGRHSWFDSISGNKARSPGDLPSKRRISRARKLLNSPIVADFRAYANKFVAHASTEESRKKKHEMATNLSLMDLESAYKDLIGAAKIIERLIGEYILSEVPVPQFYILEGWDSSLMDKDSENRLQEFWSERKAFLSGLERESRLP